MQVDDRPVVDRRHDHIGGDPLAGSRAVELDVGDHRSTEVCDADAEPLVLLPPEGGGRRAALALSLGPLADWGSALVSAAPELGTVALHEHETTGALTLISALLLAALMLNGLRLRFLKNRPSRGAAASQASTAPTH